MGTGQQRIHVAFRGVSDDVDRERNAGVKCGRDSQGDGTPNLEGFLLLGDEGTVARGSLQGQTDRGDETSRKKGHKYVTNFVDLDSRGVIYVTNGKDSTTFTEFADYLEKHGGKRDNITQASMDMSAAFESGVRNEFPNANVVFDKFHVIQAANCAMDSIRKDERRDNENLKNQRFAMLYDNDNLAYSGINVPPVAETNVPAVAD